MNNGEYEISTDRARLDLAMVHDFLSNRSYWAQGIPFVTVEQSVENALCFGVYLGGKQVGFARVITDYATFAYIGDVFIIEDHRGRGLGKRLVKAIMGHPELQGLRLWILGTKDAHGLYERYGFQKLADSPLLERFMVIRNQEAYNRAQAKS